MANISEFLRKIKTARKGVEVRDSIHDSIKAMNDEIVEDLGGMIEDGNEVIQSMHDEIQSVEQMKLNGELNMKPEDLTEAQWANVKTDLTNYYKRYESTYTTTAKNETNIPINIRQYNTLAILEVYIEGRMLTREEYTINGTYSIILNQALSEIGTKVHFVVYRSVCANNEDLDKLKGDKGDSGAIVFDTVADMKANTSLVAGDTCQTLGYHSVNDGGGSTYKIVDDTTLTADNGSVHNLTNGLKAKLIIKDSLNVRQFGAYGDRNHDDTNAIQNTIDFLYNKISNDLTNNCFLYNNVFEITEGIYKITDTIDFPNILKLSIVGNPQLLMNVDNKTALYINSRGLNGIDTAFHQRQMFISGKIISAKGGGALTIRQEPEVYVFSKFINNESTSIGIEFGDRSRDTSVVMTSRMRMADINISGFNTGLAINTVNVYCDTFENMHIERNNNSIIWGNDKFVNSGERITFKNCIFACSIRGLHVKQPFDTMLFDNCSFDFIQNVAYVERGNGHIVFKGGHIEGVGATDVPDGIKNMLGYGYICYYNNTIDSNEKLNFTIDGTTSYVSKKITNNNITKHKFGTSYATTWATGRNLNVVVENYLIKWGQNEFPFSSEAVFLADENTNIHFKSNVQRQGKEPYFGSSNIDLEGQFRFYDSDDFFSQNTQYIWKNANADEMHIYDNNSKLSSDLTPFFTKAIRLTKNTYNNAKPGLSKRFYSVKSRHMRVLLIYKLTNVNTQVSDYDERPALSFLFRGENDLNLGNTLYNEIESSKVINSINEDGWKCVVLNVEVPASCNNIIVITEFEIYSNSSYQSWTGNVNIGGLLVDFY